MRETGSRPSRSGERRLSWLWLAMAASLVFAVFAVRPPSRIDNVLYDVLTRANAHPADDSILIVDIDDRSLARMGAWPWGRDTHARMVDQLTQAGAKTIVYDVLFSQPSRDPAQDRALGEAIARSGRVYLPEFLIDGGEQAPPRVVGSISEIARGAAGVGLAHVRFDDDGVVRRMAPFEANGPSLKPDLMTVVHRATRPPGSPDVTRGNEQTLLISFAGPPSIYRHASFASVLDGEVPRELIAGRTVFVGLTAPGLGPAFPTPVTPDAASMTGVQLQASVLDALRSGRMITPAGPWSRVGFSLTLLWLLMIGFMALPPRANLLLTIGLCLVGLAYSAALFWLSHIWLSPITTVIGLQLVALIWGWGRLGQVNDLIGRELARVRAVVRGRGAKPAAFSGDVVTRQASSLGDAITRMDDLRRFSADALFSLPDATLVANEQGRVIAANAAAQALFKPHQATLNGASLADLINLLDPLGRRFELDWPQATDRHDPIDLHLPDGRAFQLQTVLRRDEHGGPAGWIVRLADISILTAAMRQREQALQLLTHDMRSPQTSILALLATTPDLPKETADRIAAYARRTLALADGFVQLARAEVTPVSLEPLDLADVAVEAIDEVWPQSLQRKIRIEQVGGEAPLMVLGDRSVLARTFVNLLGNALKYSPSGSTITVNLAEQPSPSGPVACIAIADQGPGFSREEAATAFRPFQRFERPGHELASNGVGLGLAFVQAAVARHGGEVSCRSEPGVGAEFTVRLPRHGVVQGG
ncbi:CHASE2 domain-containing protein [Caulobacter vibrioides]|uniref:CHASE2 domain-containing protein n=1 Tax=Caulobacter vibrioides TaxID=155892 RepID=UPI000BB48BC5|nr:CHASE2 domain-containing protein [Caulobacter vibrioides]ATC26208.1 CHASE2 domain-containing protein [Caulobacter vibrioides]AZH14346.1 CHASE2 domain-containing protein [Caulobacter vibrioides]PLR10938.1 CHASE2 domain-containing protein [Caulobacter vibrioides]